MNRSNVPGFDEFLEKNKSLATASEAELRDELESRNLKRPFPLHVFNESIKPFLNALHNEYDIPRSYIGLGVLCAYSTAIGTGYHVQLNRIGKVFLPIWACLEGISSSGKSLVMHQVFKPHLERQKEYDREWMNELDSEETERKPKQIVYRDSHVQTLVRYVMPSNPKGILKDADEILEWINGLNQISRKEGIDEQFWMSSWNCRPYSAIRARNQKFQLPRPFVNVFGGIQPSVLFKLFKNDRDKTGFVYRLLFAVPEQIKIANPNLEYDMPQEFEDTYSKAIVRMIDELPVGSEVDDFSRVVRLNTSAAKELKTWSTKQQNLINRIQDSLERENQAGIFGKIKEYCIRFAALLHIADLSHDNYSFGTNEEIESETMMRAIELAEYFFESAMNVSKRVTKSIIAPPEVIQVAACLKAGYSYQRVGDELFNSKGSTPGSRKKKAERAIKRMIMEYPRVFNANAN